MSYSSEMDFPFRELKELRYADEIQCTMYLQIFCYHGEQSVDNGHSLFSVTLGKLLLNHIICDSLWGGLTQHNKSIKDEMIFVVLSCLLWQYTLITVYPFSNFDLLTRSTFLCNLILIN